MRRGVNCSSLISGVERLARGRASVAAASVGLSRHALDSSRQKRSYNEYLDIPRHVEGERTQPLRKIRYRSSGCLDRVRCEVNIAQGEVPHPAAFFVVIVGIVLFLVAKISVISRKKRVSFGPSHMTENMANAYRVGYWLMVVGILFTFL